MLAMVNSAYTYMCSVNGMGACMRHIWIISYAACGGE
jgi:hypothetical protein